MFRFRKYHLGTVVKGQLLMMVFKPVKWVIKGYQKVVHWCTPRCCKKDGLCGKCISCACCHYFDKLSKMAYLIVSVG